MCPELVNKYPFKRKHGAQQRDTSALTPRPSLLQSLVVRSAARQQLQIHGYKIHSLTFSACQLKTRRIQAARNNIAGLYCPNLPLISGIPVRLRNRTQIHTRDSCQFLKLAICKELFATEQCERIQPRRLIMGPNEGQIGPGLMQPTVTSNNCATIIFPGQQYAARSYLQDTLVE